MMGEYVSYANRLSIDIEPACSQASELCPIPDSYFIDVA